MDDYIPSGPDPNLYGFSKPHVVGLPPENKISHVNNIKNIIDANPMEDVEDINRLVKQINNYLRNNHGVNSLDTKHLNSEIYVKRYIFCKSSG